MHHDNSIGGAIRDDTAVVNTLLNQNPCKLTVSAHANEPSNVLTERLDAYALGVLGELVARRPDLTIAITDTEPDCEQNGLRIRTVTVDTVQAFSLDQVGKNVPTEIFTNEDYSGQKKYQVGNLLNDTTIRNLLNGADKHLIVRGNLGEPEEALQTRLNDRIAFLQEQIRAAGHPNQSIIVDKRIIEADPETSELEYIGRFHIQQVGPL